MTEWSSLPRFGTTSNIMHPTQSAIAVRVATVPAASTLGREGEQA